MPFDIPPDYARDVAVLSGGMSFVVPEDAVTDAAAYDQAILTAVAAGQYEMPFVKVTSTWKGHTATFYMTQDALKIDGVRWGMGAKLMQQVADLLGCMLPTPRLRDLLYVQRTVTILPVTYSMIGKTVNDISKTETMRLYSAEIDRRLKAAGFDGTGIVAETGKPWVITNELLSNPGKACNYGWAVPPGTPDPWLGVTTYPAETDPSFHVIQQPGFAHGDNQSDYSEVARLVHRSCIVDGQTRDLVDVLQDPELVGLVSHEGVLKVLRQPGVSVYACPMPASAQTAARFYEPVAGEICPAPPPPADVAPPERSGVGPLVATTLALAATVGGFFLGMKLLGHAKPHPNPLPSGRLLEPGQVIAFYNGKVVDMKYVPAGRQRFNLAAMRIVDNGAAGYVLEGSAKGDKLFFVGEGSRTSKLVTDAAIRESVIHEIGALLGRPNPLGAESLSRSELQIMRDVLEQEIDEWSEGAAFAPSWFKEIAADAGVTMADVRLAAKADPMQASWRKAERAWDRRHEIAERLTNQVQHASLEQVDAYARYRSALIER